METNSDPPEQARLLESVRTSFPYPVARAARTYGYVARDDVRSRYGAALHTAENIIKTLGVLGLTWARASGYESPAILKWREALNRGLSLGLWVAVARDTPSGLPGDSDPFGLRTMFASRRGGSLATALDALVTARNRHAHDGPIRSEAEVSERLHAIQPQLMLALRLASPLADVSFLFVERSARTRGGGFSNSGLRLIGDHPEFAQMTVDSDEALIEKTVYVVAPDGRAFDTTPYLVLRECPVCRNREVFFLDRTRGAQSIFKSSDTPHEFREEGADHPSDWASPVATTAGARFPRWRSGRARASQPALGSTRPRARLGRWAPLLSGVLLLIVLAVLWGLHSGAPRSRLRSHSCSSSYPTVCLPVEPAGFGCHDLKFSLFPVVGTDPDHLDPDGNGIGCDQVSLSLTAKKTCTRAYVGFCIAPPPPDLDCSDLLPATSFRLRQVVGRPEVDPHHLDPDHDYVACEG